MRIAFLLAGALALAGCGSHEPKKAEASERPPVAVQVAEVTNTEWAAIYEAPGTVRARASATLASKVMGYVREIRVQPGSGVKAGQVLVVLDARDLDSGLKQAEAAEDEARSAVAEADNGIAAAKAQLDLANVTFQRMEDLFAKRSISNQEFDEARARYRTAQAGFEMAQSKRRQLDARIAQARQGVESAHVSRSYAEIRAPFSGIVTEKRADQGQLATPGTPLLVLEAAGGFRLEAPVEESMLGTVRLGQAVSVAFDGSAQTVKARVDEIVPAVDPMSRSFIVKASLPPMASVRSGLFGRLQLSRGVHEAVTVPANAVLHRGDLQSAFVVDAGHARSRMITTGAQRDGRLEVLSGLRAGEKVISPAPDALVDGSRVEVRP